MTSRRFISVFALIAVFALLGFSAKTATASGIIKPANNLGLVGYWSFEDGTSTKATDFSGKGNTGTLTNGPTWTGGKLGKSLSFDGNDDYVDAVDDPFDLTDLTLSAWVKTSQTSDGFIFGKGTTADYQYGLYNNFGASKKAVFVVWTTAGGSYLMASSTNAISTNQWVHLAATVSGTTAKLYVNGTLEETDSNPVATRDISGIASFSIGRRGDTTDPFSGLLDEVRVYNRALSSTEVAGLYEASKVSKINASANLRGPQNGLVGQWSFDGADMYGTTAYDRSGGGNNGTLTNGPAQAQGKIGQAIRFDGVNDYVNLTHQSGLPIYSTTTPYSVSVWVKPETGGDAVKEIYEDAGPLHFFRIRLINQELRVQVYDGVDNTDKATSDNTVVYNQWNHVVYTDNVGTAKMYVNGVQDSASFNYTAPTSSMSLTASRLGTFFVSLDYFKGAMDDLRLYNRVLSAAEVQQLYALGGGATVNKATGDPLSSNLVLWHTFDGPKLNTTTSTDSSGQGNNGTLTNGPVPVMGKRGQALRFDGVDDYVLGASSTFLNVNPVTVSAWIRTNAPSTRQYIAGKEGADNNEDPGCGQGYAIFIDNSKAVFIVDPGGCGNTDNLEGTTTIQPNTWYFVTGVYDGVTAYIYLNGVQENSVARTLNAHNIFSSIGGQYGHAGGNSSINFNGLIDDVRIYNKALSSSEVLQLYNATK